MLFVGQMYGLVKKFNTEINSDTINVINVKPCMMVLLTEFIPLSVTLTTFQDPSNVEEF